jgi:hypothetical protein
VYDSIYLTATLLAPGPEQLITLVATWQGALRDIQIHGFALLMILGVSQRIFPFFYGAPIPNTRLSLVALWCLNLAIAGEALCLVLLRTGGPIWIGVWYGSVWLLGATVLALVINWRVFAGVEKADRSLKFLRTAYAWLLVSLAMLILLPVYQFYLLPQLAPESGAVHLGFSHAYYGAIRHAITVGFVSLMIMGVAAKVVPTLNGVAINTLTSLWAPFVLLNAGCALRVGSQTLTDVTNSAFPAAGVSGLLEVTALALWGVHLWRLMNRGQTIEATAHPGQASGTVSSHDFVGDVLDRHPELVPIFVSFGFQPLTNPVLRRTMARHVTVGGACQFLGVDLDIFLKAVNEACAVQAKRRRSLPLVS